VSYNIFLFSLNSHPIGLILRKTLCGLLKLKAYSTASLEPRKPDGGIVLAQAATVFYDTLERTYPNFPDVKSVKLSEKELVRTCVLTKCNNVMCY
jgi:hypothetical protein